MQLMLAIFLGGGLGSLARYGVSRAARNWYSTDFPLGTLLANVLATALLAVAVYMLKDKLTEGSFLRPFIVIGFCGGFSTFSTFSYETFELMRNGFMGLALLNVVLSLAICLGVVWAVYLAER